MSQFWTGVTAGSLPPTVPTSFITDDGTAIPASNILNINGIDSTENNSNGILTRANPTLSDNLEIIITNRLQGTSQTVDLATTTIVSFTPTVIGTYSLECRISAYNTTALLGAGYSLFGAVRFDGVNSNLCDIPDKISNEEGSMSASNANMSVSGADILVTGTGYAAQTINWSAVCLYTYIGA